jgi:curli biogenesis system outer membrane secretion channel CsgG
MPQQLVLSRAYCWQITGFVKTPPSEEFMRRLAGVFILSLLIATTAVAQNKKRVAVLDFEYGTVATSIHSIFGGHYDVGKGIRDLMVEKLVNGGVYSVIERAALEKVLQEQNFSTSDRANPASAAQLGKVLGVDTIIIGSITQFGRDDKNTKVKTGAFGRFGAAIGGVGRSKAKAVVAITARMIDVNTAEILAVATGEGESTRDGTSLLGGGYGGGGGGGAAIDMTSSNFANTIIGEAVNEAVEPVARELESGADRIASTKIEVDGLVADYADGTVIVNVGSSVGVKVGDRLQIKRVTREVKDPATGKVLRRIEETLGEITITEVDETSAVGTYAGATPPKVGDTVGN